MSKILVLDDNEAILEAIHFILSRRKIVVVTIADPTLLLPYLQMHEPDLLLMDISLGCYDGRELCYQLKSSPSEKYLPIVLFSAKSYTPASITACGADAFMEKPFHIQNLYTVLEQLLPQEA